MATNINYQGPKKDTLPPNVARVVDQVIAALPKPTQGPAAVELQKTHLPGQEPDFNPRDYRLIHASDDRGLVQTVFYEQDASYNIRITGLFPKGAREKAVGYDKANLVVLRTPEQSASTLDGHLARMEGKGYPWLIEGERR